MKYASYELMCTKWKEVTSGRTSQEALVVNNPPTNAGNAKDRDSILRSVRSAGGGNGNSLQYSCLENSTDRGASWAFQPRSCQELDMTEHAYIESHTWLKLFSVIQREQGGPTGKVYK